MDLGITGLHLLLTYECNLCCDHCFVWGSPRQSGTMKMSAIEEILRQADRLGSVEWIYFEGGEPFLHYGLLLKGAQSAARRGYSVGLVTNAFWAVSEAAAVERLKPLAGVLQDLSISSDLYHGDTPLSRQAQNAVAAAGKLEIPVELIRIAGPGAADPARGIIPPGESGVVFRGRAAEELTGDMQRTPWREFRRCPHEDLRTPERVHLDPLGYVHVCQGIAIGNFLERPLAEILTRYDPDNHPVTGPLLRGGPAELARHHGVACETGYADACHLCYRTRCSLRGKFPRQLAPGQMYGAATGG